MDSIVECVKIACVKASVVRKSFGQNARVGSSPTSSTIIMSYSIKVVHQILVLSVEVRILVGQRLFGSSSVNWLARRIVDPEVGVRVPSVAHFSK